MRNTRIVLVAVLSGICLGLCVLLSLGLKGKFLPSGAGNTAYGNYHLVLEKEFAADSIDNIHIKYAKSGNDVIVYTSQSPESTIVVREYANYSPAESELAEAKTAGTGLTVTGPWRANSIINLNRFIYTEIYLPAGYTGELDITTTSGDIEITQELSLEKDLYLKSTSGDISLAGITTENIKVSSTSGEVYITKADGGLTCSTTSGNITVLGGAGNRRISSTSGDVQIESCSGHVSSSTTSGNISIYGSDGAGSISSTSGDVLFSVEELSGDLTVHTSSGEVSLELPSQAALAFEAGTSSGEINTFFDDDLKFSKRGDHAEGSRGDGTLNKIKITTTSGDITVWEH